MNFGSPSKNYPILERSGLIPISITSGQTGFAKVKAEGYFEELEGGKYRLKAFIDMNQSSANTSSYTIRGIIPDITAVTPVQCVNDSGTAARAYIDNNALVSMFHGAVSTSVFTIIDIILASRPVAYLGE